nr:GNAT family N-acetyltransferase [Ruegeria arenilitoris]
MMVKLRPARSTDAGATGEILHGFTREHDWMPELHTRAETIAFCGRMIELDWMTVAETDLGVVGFLSLNEDEVHSLYLAPNARGQGIGQRLLDHAKARRSELSLFAFQANHGALRFYERNGFVETGRSDGADNDENLPDIKFVWASKGAADG